MALCISASFTSCKKKKAKVKAKTEKVESENEESSDSEASSLSSKSSSNGDYSLQDLMAELEELNSELPEEIEDGMVMTEVKLVGKSVEYTVVVDEDMYDIDQMRSNKSMIRKEMRKIFSDDADLRQIKSTGLNLRYHYIGADSGDDCVITLTNDEL